MHKIKSSWYVLKITFSLKNDTNVHNTLMRVAKKTLQAVIERRTNWFEFNKCLETSTISQWY